MLFNISILVGNNDAVLCMEGIRCPIRSLSYWLCNRTCKFSFVFRQLFFVSKTGNGEDGYSVR